MTCAEEMRKSYTVSVEKSKVKCCLEDLDVNGRVVLKWILKKRGGRGRNRFICLRTWMVTSPQFLKISFLIRGRENYTV